MLFNVQFDLITCSCNPLFLSLTLPAIYVLQNKLYKSFLFRASLMTEIVREVIVLIIALKLKYFVPLSAFTLGSQSVSVPFSQCLPA